MLTTAAPRRLAGAVVPMSGIGITTIGTPRRASSSVALVISGSCSSGATVQLIAEKMGRSRRLAPATASNPTTMTQKYQYIQPVRKPASWPTRGRSLQASRAYS